MKIIVWIIIIVFGLSIVMALFEWIFDHLIPFLILLITVIGLILWPKQTLVIVGILIGSYLLLRISKGFLKKIYEICQNWKKMVEDRRAQQRKEKAYAEHMLELPEQARIIIKSANGVKKNLLLFQNEIDDIEMKEVIRDFLSTVDDLTKQVESNPSQSNKLKKAESYYFPTITNPTFIQAFFTPKIHFCPLCILIK